MKMLLLAAALAVPVASANAQTPERTAFGVQVSFADDAEFGIGGRVRYGLQGLFPRAPLSSIASADIFFPGNDIDYFEINYNVVYNFRVSSAPRVGPYAGAGLNFARISAGNASNTDLGLNLVGGISFKAASSRVTPFLELRAELGGGEQLVFTGGILF
jgi:hypothetical protein